MHFNIFFIVKAKHQNLQFLVIGRLQNRCGDTLYYFINFLVFVVF